MQVVTPEKDANNLGMVMVINIELKKRDQSKLGVQVVTPEKDAINLGMVMVNIHNMTDNAPDWT